MIVISLTERYFNFEALTESERQLGLSAVKLQLSVQLPWGISTGPNMNTFPWFFCQSEDASNVI
jgi:hypothetical protein